PTVEVEQAEAERLRASAVPRQRREQPTGGGRRAAPRIERAPRRGEQHPRGHSRHGASAFGEGPSRGPVAGDQFSLRRGQPSAAATRRTFANQSGLNSSSASRKATHSARAAAIPLFRAAGGPSAVSLDRTRTRRSAAAAARSSARLPSVEPSSTATSSQSG